MLSHWTKSKHCRLDCRPLWPNKENVYECKFWHISHLFYSKECILNQLPLQNPRRANGSSFAISTWIFPWIQWRLEPIHARLIPSTMITRKAFKSSSWSQKLFQCSSITAQSSEKKSYTWSWQGVRKENSYPLFSLCNFFMRTKLCRRIMADWSAVAHIFPLCYQFDL